MGIYEPYRLPHTGPLGTHRQPARARHHNLRHFRTGFTDDVSKAVFNVYVDAGGNFIDTADVYAGGRSEKLLGGFIAERRLRDTLVLATKFAFNAKRGNPNAGGNGRKNIYRALHSSLRRLKTDYIDLYWLHVWDMVTPVEETCKRSATWYAPVTFATSVFQICPPGMRPSRHEASALESANFFSDELKRIVFGGTSVQGWR